MSRFLDISLSRSWKAETNGKTHLYKQLVRHARVLPSSLGFPYSASRHMTSRLRKNVNKYNGDVNKPHYLKLLSSSAPVLPTRNHYSDICGIFILTFYLTISDILSGIYFDILSDILSGICILTYFLAYILTFFLAFYLASILTFYLASFQAFILAYVLTFSLTFFLVYVSGIASGILSDTLW